LVPVRKVLVFLGTVLVAGAVLAGAVAVAAPQLAAIATAGDGEPQPIDLAALENYAVRSEVLASDGGLLATLHGDQNRQPVALDQVPEPVVDSILAIEDAEFYLHGGVNARSIMRALVENVSAGGVEQGGSTITQQLVKNAVTGDDDVTAERKIREAVLATRLEEQLSKDQILETYLNTVYFGAGAYGVQAAAEVYWGKNVQDLGWAEGAMLAALIANPVSYDPTLYPERALQQRAIAYDRLVSLEYLTRDEADLLSLVPLPTARCTGNPFGRPDGCGEVDTPPVESYFVEKVKNDLLDVNNHSYDILGTTYEERKANVFGGGLRIHTTLDRGAQFAAEVAFAEEPPKNLLGVTTAFVGVEPGSGAVRALVGGPTFGENKYDIATQEPGRQTGSTFKTFVLLEALEQGALPDDRMSGSISMTDPGTLKPYSVSGSSGTLRSITTASSNGAFVRLNQVVGPDNVVDLATRLGMELPSNAGKTPSLPLGVSDQTPLEMAAAYNAIPSGGMFVPPYFVERVEDGRGNVIFERQPAGTRAFSSRTACVATDILRSNVESGTGRNARIPGQVAAGKTGTTTGPTDVWFVGFTPYLTTAVWLGHPEQGAIPVDPDTGRPTERSILSNVAQAQAWGSVFPAQIWQRFNELYHESRDPRDFPECDEPYRSARALSGENDPFGTLNGGYDPTGIGVLSGPMEGKYVHRSQSSSTGGDTATTTTAPDTTTPTTQAAPTTTAPAGGGGGGGAGGGAGGGPGGAGNGGAATPQGADG
jgi:membrane peptidoglycan carboxypeptidase